MGDVALIMAYDAKGLLLLGKRKDSGKWTLPAGHIEDGESPEDGARRELFEEAGLRATSLSPLKVMETPHGKLYFFTAYVTGTPHGDNDPDDECGDSWEFVDVSDGLPKKFQALAGPKDDTNIVRQLFEMKKSEDEVTTLLQHPNPSERLMALKLYSVLHHHVQTAALDPDPEVHAAALDHELFDHDAGMHLMEAPLGDMATDSPTPQQRAFLSRPGLASEHHLEAALRNGGGRLDDILATHPAMTAALIAQMHSDPHVSMEHRTALLGHPNTPADLLGSAVRTAMLIPHAHLHDFARVALARPTMPQEVLADLVRSGSDHRAQQHVFNLAHFALENAAIPHGVIKTLLQDGKTRTDAPHARLRAAAVSGPSATPEHIDEVLRDRDANAWKSISGARALQTRHISVMLQRLLAEVPRDDAAIKSLAGAKSFGVEHLNEILAQPMAKSERLAKAINPEHLTSIAAATDTRGGDIVDHAAELNAHPPAHSHEVEAFRQQVLHSPKVVEGGKKGFGKMFKHTASKKVVFKAKVPGNTKPSAFLVKPYHEEIISGVRSYQRHLHQGWSEMTNQALFHAGGIGHLHQHVHVDEMNMGPGQEKVPVTVTYIAPDHTQVADYRGDHYPTRRKIGEDSENAANVRKIGIMSFLANAQDQHGGNFMVHNTTGAPLAIDNARNFQYISPHRRQYGPKETFEHYFEHSALDQLEPISKPSPVKVDPGAVDANGKFVIPDRHLAISNSLHAARMDTIERFTPTFEWWGDNSAKIRQSFNERLQLIKDQPTREHIARNFNERADWLDERARMGIENYGQDWFRDRVQLYRPGEVTDEESNSTEMFNRAQQLKNPGRVVKKPKPTKNEAQLAFNQWVGDRPSVAGTQKVE